MLGKPLAPKVRAVELVLIVNVFQCHQIQILIWRKLNQENYPYWDPGKEDGLL